MRTIVKIIGWVLIIASGIVYFSLWQKAVQYVELKIGKILAIIILIFTNIIGPLLYVIWHWISDGFPTIYFIIWILTIIIFIIGINLAYIKD